MAFCDVSQHSISALFELGFRNRPVVSMPIVRFSHWYGLYHIVRLCLDVQCWSWGETSLKTVQCEVHGRALSGVFSAQITFLSPSSWRMKKYQSQSRACTTFVKSVLTGGLGLPESKSSFHLMRAIQRLRASRRLSMSFAPSLSRSMNVFARTR